MPHPSHLPSSPSRRGLQARCRIGAVGVGGRTEPAAPAVWALLTACLWFSFQAERPALNVVIFPLLRKGLTDVIRDVPMVHLDEITLFKSRVAEEPPNLWW